MLLAKTGSGLHSPHSPQLSQYHPVKEPHSVYSLFFLKLPPPLPSLFLLCSSERTSWPLKGGLLHDDAPWPPSPPRLVSHVHRLPQTSSQLVTCVSPGAFTSLGGSLQRAHQAQRPRVIMVSTPHTLGQCPLALCAVPLSPLPQADGWIRTWLRYWCVSPRAAV